MDSLPALAGMRWMPLVKTRRFRALRHGTSNLNMLYQSWKPTRDSVAEPDTSYQMASKRDLQYHYSHSLGEHALRCSSPQGDFYMGFDNRETLLQRIQEW